MCVGTRRRKVLVPHDSTALLNQLRLEKRKKGKENNVGNKCWRNKKRGRNFEQTLQSWEDELLEQPIKDYMRTMWEVGICSYVLQDRFNVSE